MLATCYILDSSTFLSGIMYAIYPVALVHTSLADTQYWTEMMPRQLRHHSILTLKKPILSSTGPHDDDDAPPLLRFNEVLRDEGLLLGRGATAKVFGGRYRGQAVAIKLCELLSLSAESVSECEPMAEAVMTHQLRHPNVVGVYGYFLEPPYFGIVMDKCQHDLASQLESRQMLDWGGKVSVAIQAARAIAHMHAQVPPVIHRDIKWSNFLVGSDQKVKLADFGEAIECGRAGEELDIVGSPIYICLLYTSDAADEEDSVDLGGRRIIKKKKNTDKIVRCK
eukprot:TRINITY_DN19083_c0_g1_i1.p1 TRINITY_DN19083_c0_g1~~TRINITY_DN19083_c0_g1_i1.p1  ORF type:complete len:281 (-),score=56.89 TRINITY_DN19083_c0_g1_i1:84-926(-)